jgi:hypothetical protein
MLGGKPESVSYSLGTSVITDPVAVDYGKLDYLSYERMYYGRLQNFEIAGLFFQPIVRHIADFMIGRGMSIQVDAPKEATEVEGRTVLTPTYTNQLLTRWTSASALDFYNIVVQTMKFGDYYTAIEDDGSITHIAPTNVNKVFDPLSGRVLSFQIYSKTTEIAGNGRAVEYVYRDTRTYTERTIERRLASAPDRPSSWQSVRLQQINPDGTVVALPNPIPNTIGRLDVVHWTNNRSAADAYGYSEVYPLVTLLRRYDDLMNSALIGNKLMGRPTPVFKGIKDVKGFIEMFGVVRRDASGATRLVMDWKAEQVQVLGEGADFVLASPLPFASDTATLLNILFWILSQHSSVPEFVWGIAVQGSKASVGEQMPPFQKFIEGKRKQFQGTPSDELLGTTAKDGFHELTDIWLRKRKLNDGKVSLDDPTVITWPDMTDREAELTRRLVEYALNQGIMTEGTALRIINGLIGDFMPDVSEELTNARTERVERAAAEAAGASTSVTSDQRPNGTNPDGSPVAASGTSDGTASGQANNRPGNNQFTGRDGTQ